MYHHQRPTAPLATQTLSGQRLVDLAFILALISILIVVALSLLGPAIGDTVTMSTEKSDPAPSITTAHPESSIMAPAMFNGSQVAVDIVNLAPR